MVTHMSKRFGKVQRAILDELTAKDATLSVRDLIGGTEGEAAAQSLSRHRAYQRALRGLVAAGLVEQIHDDYGHVPSRHAFGAPHRQLVSLRLQRVPLDLYRLKGATPTAGDGQQ